MPPQTQPPDDADRRRAAPAIVCYAVDRVPPCDLALYRSAREGMTRIAETIVPPREARTFEVPAGHFFRIVSIEGPQVGDLNLWNASDLSERFFSGKTRALHATHVGTGDRLWSSLPHLRPLATITHDTLDWYGWDADGAGVHDVIGTRCDPYTQRLLGGDDYHHCCHSNLTRALADHRGLPLAEAEPHVHDVLNVFMCTGFTRDAHRYFMKASPVRPGDFLELFAEIDLLGALSACPGGDCGSSHSSDAARCHPLKVEIYRPREGALAAWRPPERNAYARSHGR
ncbi:urea carboxylase-associated family protein [Reyranella sp.]|uniref:urea carboxylase-associated family protein n=1 Tax=Reyranella sp. TaxID=1929291 RepID=UPI003BA9E028